MSATGSEGASGLARRLAGGVVAVATALVITGASIALFFNPAWVSFAQGRWGGLLKNIYAIGLGIFDGKEITSVNFRAAYLTIALEEMSRIGIALGGQRFRLPCGPGRSARHLAQRRKP